mmetsp:Transcript_43719/g.140404  ORF Transcript_43719/g.140404 Transcript_43719/m.140404 type:complete len:232 (+) Transcript_43719:22-717(+)
MDDDQSSQLTALSDLSTRGFSLVTLQSTGRLGFQKRGLERLGLRHVSTEARILGGGAAGIWYHDMGWSKGDVREMAASDPDLARAVKFLAQDLNACVKHEHLGEVAGIIYCMRNQHSDRAKGGMHTFQANGFRVLLRNLGGRVHVSRLSVRLFTFISWTFWANPWASSPCLTCGRRSSRWLSSTSRTSAAARRSPLTRPRPARSSPSAARMLSCGCTTCACSAERRARRRL